MKRMLIICLALAAFFASGSSPQPKVMARAVPERSDDFIFENELICARIYGKAMEKKSITPGVDIWVKLPGKLVADEWYVRLKEEKGYYHRDHGGKDCYKVGVSLGGGASAPWVNGKLRYPATNYRDSEILESTPDKVVFVLRYPEWDCDSIKVSLEKKITVTSGTYFCKCEDRYVFSGCDTLTVAAGISRHQKQQTVEEERMGDGFYAIWEQASDQHAEPEDGRIGVAVVMPDAEKVFVTKRGNHGLCTKKLLPGETLTYWFGSCWGKGDIQTPEAWFEMVCNFSPVR